MHHHRNFCWNRSKWFYRYHVFFYFPDGNRPPCWIIKTIKFYMLPWLGETRHITMPNFFKTGLSAKQRYCNFSIFTARGYAKRGICRRRVSVCRCVCLSVTLRYCIKTAKRRITQTTPHDSPMTLVFWCQRSWRNSNGITPYGATNAGGVVKIGHFRRKTRYNSKTVQDRRIVSIKVE